jgi:hypothetical protein
VPAGVSIAIDFKDYIALPSLTDVEFWGTGSTNNTTVSVDYDMEVIDD